MRPGQRVAAGQRVATVGDFNGCHVHVEASVRRDGVPGGGYWLVEPVAALRAVMAGEAPEPTAPEPAAPALEVVTAIADGAGRNRPRTTLLAGDLWVTVHETGNANPGADAMMHREFVDRGGGAERVSFHFAVDDIRAVQILPLNERGYHAGDGCDEPDRDHGCFRSVAIEVCVNAPAGSARWAAAKRNAAALIALIVSDPGRFVGGAGLAGRFSFDRVAPHRQWSGKNCPQRMLAEGSLPALVAQARALAAGGAAPEPPAKRFPVDVPDDVVLALFPAADPNGPVTRAWMAAGLPPFVRAFGSTDGWTYWMFTSALLRSKDGGVEEVTP